MTVTKPVPTYIGAFIKGGCVSVVVLRTYLVLDFIHNPIAGNVCIFAIGGFAGLFMWWNYRQYFTAANMNDARKTPIKIGAFLKGGCIGWPVFLAYLILDDLLLGVDNEAYEIIRIIICSFLPGGCVGLFLRWNYQKYFTAANTPQTDATP